MVEVMEALQEVIPDSEELTLAKASEVVSEVVSEEVTAGRSCRNCLIKNLVKI